MLSTKKISNLIGIIFFIYILINFKYFVVAFLITVISVIIIANYRSKSKLKKNSDITLKPVNDRIKTQHENIGLAFKRLELNTFLFCSVKNFSLPKPFVKKHLIKSENEMSLFLKFEDYFNLKNPITFNDYYQAYKAKFGTDRKYLKFLQILVLKNNIRVNVHTRFGPMVKTTS